MDGERFDEIAKRTWAASDSRRGVIKRLGAGLAAALAGTLSRERPAAAAPRCSSDADCGGTACCIVEAVPGPYYRGCCERGQICDAFGHCCTQVLGCRPGLCGRHYDNCQYQDVNCGDCAPGQTCANGTCVCTAESCPNGCCLGAACRPGNTRDACGAPGGACQVCASGQPCIAGVCRCTSNSCPSGCCDVDTCRSGDTDQFCGTRGQGCRTCGGRDTCGGGGVTGACGCTGKTRQEACAGKTCGFVSDGCYFTFNCGDCAPGQTCDNGTCTCSGCAPGQTCVNGACACTAESCPNGCCLGADCQVGTAADACGAPGGACQVCAGGQVCHHRRCCTPKSPAEACGTQSCGTALDGCGGEVSCGGCGGGEVCDGGRCVVACPTGKTACNAICVNLKRSPRNCGGCGRRCRHGKRCRGGRCVQA